MKKKKKTMRDLIAFIETEIKDIEETIEYVARLQFKKEQKPSDDSTYNILVGEVAAMRRVMAFVTSEEDD